LFNLALLQGVHHLKNQTYGVRSLNISTFPHSRVCVCVCVSE
jgi:hypothetical protein